MATSQLQTQQERSLLQQQTDQGNDYGSSQQQLGSQFYSAQTSARNVDTNNSARSIEHVSQQSEALTQDSILKHHMECKVENKQRLKEVKNLEDLINFRITTVSDKLMEDGTLVNAKSQAKGLYGLRQVVDPLLTSKAFPAVSQKGRKSQLHHRHEYENDEILINTNNLNEDSMMLDNVSVKDVTFEQPTQSTVKFEDKFTKVVNPSTGVHTKVDLSRVMSETGTILLEKKTVNQQIEEILRLDDQDPIRKLQMYFKDTPYGHEYDDEGTRIPRKYKAPKHKNHIMQRYENKRQRDLTKKNQSQERALSQLQNEYELKGRNQSSGAMSGLLAAKQQNALQQNQSLDYPSQRYASQQAIRLNNASNLQEFKDSQSINSEMQQQSFGPMGNRMAILKAQLQQPASEKRLIQTNFMSQLRHLQDLLKESMLDAVKDTDRDEEKRLDQIETIKSSRKNLHIAQKESSNDLVLPQIEANISKDDVQKATNARKSLKSIQKFRRGTIADFQILDQIKASGNETQDMINKYMPKFTRKHHESSNENSIQRSLEENSGNENGIGEASQETSQQTLTGQTDSVHSIASYKVAKQESIDSQLLKGVDSDDEMLEKIMKQTEHIQKLQKAQETKWQGSEEQRQMAEYDKLRKYLAVNMHNLVDVSELTAEQRALIQTVTGKKVSMLSKFANIQRKDYVEYNQDQMAVYKLLNGQNDSQKRISMLQEKRKSYLFQRDGIIQSRKMPYGRKMQHSAEGKYHSVNNQKQRQPFSNKKFVEDISKPGLDFKKNKIAERLPKIQYGSQNSIQVQKYSVEFQSKPQTKESELSSTHEMMQRFDDEQNLFQEKQSNMKPIPSKNTILLGSSQRSGSLQKMQDYMHRENRIEVKSTKQQVIYSRRIPAVGVASSLSTDKVSGGANESERMRISGISPFRPTQRESEMSQSAKGEKFELRSSHQKMHEVYQNLDTSSKAYSKQFDFQGKSKLEVDRETFSNDLKEVKSEAQLDGLPATKYLNRDDIASSKSNNGHSNTNKVATVSDASSVQQVSINNMQIGSKTIQKEIKTSGPQSEMEKTYDQYRTKIELNGDMAEHKRSVMDSLHPSDSVYNYDVEPGLPPNLKDEDSILQQKHSVEPKGLPMVNNAQIAHITKSNNNLLSNSNSQAKSLTYHDSIATEHKPEKSPIMFNMEDVSKHQVASVQKEISTEEGKRLRIDTEKILKSQARIYQELTNSNEFQIVRDEDGNLNGSTETLQTGPVTMGQEREKHKKSMEEAEKSHQVQSSKELKEAEIPQNIKIRHAAQGNNSQSSQSELNGDINSSPSRRQTVQLSLDNSGKLIQTTQKKDGSTTTTIEVNAVSRNQRQQNSGLDLLREHSMQSNPVVHDGYETAQDPVDPNHFIFMNDLADSVQKRVQQKGWQAKRFKKFPRFSIYLQRDQSNTYMESNYISLNNKMLEFLAEKEPASKPNTVTIADVSQDSIESDGQGKSQTVMQSKDNSQTVVDTGQTKRGELLDSTVVVDQSMEIDLAVGLNNTSQTVREVEEAQPTPQGGQSTVANSTAHSGKRPFGEKEIKMKAKVKFQNQNNNMRNAAAGTSNRSQNVTQDSKKSKTSESEQYNAKEPLQTSIIDPFDKVLLLKNIDNAILTSFRTLTKQNNVVSHTLKVIHNKFTPKQLSKTVKNTYKNTQRALYSVSEVEDYSDYISEADEESSNAENYEIQKEIITILKPNPDIPNALTDPPATVNEYTSQHTGNYNNDAQESLVSSVEMSPKVARLRSRSNPRSKNNRKVPNSLENSKERLPIAAHNLIRTDIGNTVPDSQRHQLKSQPLDQSERVQPPGTRGEQASTPVNNLKEDQFNYISGTNNYRNNGNIDLQQTVNRSVESLSLAAKQEHSRLEMNKLKIKDQTFTSKQRATGKFGSLLFEENKQMTINSTGQIDSSAQMSIEQQTQKIKQSLKKTRSDAEDTIQDGGAQLNHQDSSQNVISTLRNTQNLLQHATENNITSNETVIAHNPTIQSFKLSNDKIGTLDAKIDSKQDSKQESKDKMTLRIPSVNKESSALQLDQKDTDTQRAVEKLYPQFNGGKIDSQRQNAVPKAAGFKLPTKTLKTIEAKKNDQKSIKIRNASVDEFLGDYSTKPSFLHGSFKTSKVILQVKGNQQIQLGRTRDQGVDQKSQSNGTGGGSAYGRDMNSQVAMNTMSTFGNQTNYSRVAGRRGSNESINNQSQQSQNAITKSIYGGQASLQILEEEKTARDGMANSNVQEDVQYKKGLQSILDQVSHVHGKKRASQGKVYPNQREQRRLSRLSKDQMSDQTVSNRDLSEDNVLYPEPHQDSSPTLKHNQNSSFQIARSSKAILQDLQRSKNSNATFEHNSQEGGELVRDDTLKIPLRHLQVNEIDEKSSKQQTPSRMASNSHQSKDGAPTIVAENFNHTQQPTLRKDQPEVAIQKVETASEKQAKERDSNPLVITSKNYEHEHSSKNKHNNSKTQDNREFIESDATPTVSRLNYFDHMMAKKSPSHASNIESTVRLAGKMQHSNATGQIQLTQASNDNILGPKNRDSGNLSSNFQNDYLDSKVATSRRTKQGYPYPSNFTAQNEDQLDNIQQQSRQTALIKQGLGEAQLLESIVSVPQPESLLASQSDATGSKKEQFSQVANSSNVVGARNKGLSIQSIKQRQQQTGTRKASLESARNHNDSLSKESLSESPQRDQGKNYKFTEEHEIAARIVQPKPAQRVRQMIDTLCLKEKSFVYQNPNIRDDCIGTQNSIFDLSNSHLVDRPGIWKEQEKMVKKNLNALNQEAVFEGASFLAGQKVQIQTVARKPKDIRKGREAHSRY